MDQSAPPVQPQPQLDPNTIMATLAAQRNAALDEIARMSAIIELLGKENEALKAKLSNPELQPGAYAPGVVPQP